MDWEAVNRSNQQEVKAMKPSERMRRLRLEQGLSVEVVAARAGVSVATIYRYEAGEISNMRADRIKPIADALNTTPGELMGWNDLPDEVSAVKDLPVKRIPMIGEAAAGVPILAEQDYETRINPCAPVDADYSVTVRGDSMAPTYLDGDVVFIREQPEVDDGCVAVVLVDDSAAVKHVVRAKDGLLLISDNPNYPPMLMRWAEHEHMRVLGVVTGYLRMYRTDPLRGVQKGFT